MSGDASSVRPSTTSTITSASSSATRAWRKISAGISCLVVGNDAAGIDHAQLLAGPFHLAVDAVAGDAGLVADDGAPRSDQPVEQRGLADVGAADNGQRADGAAVRPVRQSGWTRIACDGSLRLFPATVRTAIALATIIGTRLLASCPPTHNPPHWPRVCRRCISSSAPAACWRALIRRTSFAADSCRWPRPSSRRCTSAGT